ncbi:MAG: TAT-variant-translocated molybdopterin oxidoreductase [Terriglobia bacterium]
MSCKDSGSERLDLVSIQAKPATDASRKFWRSLSELGESPDFKDRASREFSPGGFRFNRRDALKLMGASTALAGLAACTKMPVERIVPYVNAPEGFIPDKALMYASVMPWYGAGQGVLVWSFMGRPTKVEGNNEHPGSLGRANIFMQASVLDLYDPDRLQVLMHNSQVAAWSDFLVATDEFRAAHLRNKGEGLRILTGTVTSPSLGDQLNDILKQFPQAQWHQYEAISRDNAREGARMAFGDYVETIYKFDQADVVVSLDSDFLMMHPAGVRYALDFSNKRRLTSPQSPMNRLYAVEGAPSVTGSQADHRLRLRPSQIAAFARSLAGALGVKGQGGQTSAQIPDVPSDWIPALARDLHGHRGSSVIVAGDTQPPAVHALAHAMNAALGNSGKTVVYTDSIEIKPVNQMDSFKQLVTDMNGGKVQTLLIFGGNPVYTAPADVNFKDALTHVRDKAYLGLYDDETAVECNWLIPAAHYLESWGDLRAYDGTVSTMQPLIAPLYDGKSASEILTLFQGQPGRTGHAIVHDYWLGHPPQQGKTANPANAGRTAHAARTAEIGRTAHTARAAETATAARTGQTTQASQTAAEQFEVQWQTWLEKGVIDGTAFEPKQAALKSDIDFGQSDPAPTAGDLEIIFTPDPTVWDGSFCNNGWLQELPKPFNKLTWDNAVLVSPATAEQLKKAKAVKAVGPGFGKFAGQEPLGIGPNQSTSNEVVELTFQGRKLLGPVLVMPGLADGTVAISLGYGREQAGNIGNRAGFNAYKLRTSDHLWFGTGLEVAKTGKRYALVVTQHHHLIGTGKNEQEEESVAETRRNLIRVATLDHYREKPDFAQDSPDMTTEAQSLYPVLPSPYDFKRAPQWGMSIDLSACIGCNACVIACQAENNIAVVGKDQVSRGREMHWIRIDTYYQGGVDSPQIYNEPVPCMQCENAPCEYVCPVGATVTGPEGINEMIYNRCVGTRYCSNNCPYKVRRFNFYLFSDWSAPSLYPLRNPRVTVRSRGVMEKCTYCIQRIRAHEIEAEEQNRKLRDSEILTACQQTCPANAIVFGDILDKNSNVSKRRAEPREYGLLEELNTRPRTTYLAKLWNPNPEMKA